MGIAIPQIITEDRASGAQVIEGSLRFDKDPNPNGGPMYLTKTLGSGNTKTFTLAYWFKLDKWEQRYLDHIEKTLQQLRCRLKVLYSLMKVLNVI